VRLLRVAPVSQAVLDLGPDITSAASAASAASMVVAVEWGWWRLPESARVEVIALLARLIARGVLVEDPPPERPTTPATDESTGDPGGSGTGERGE